VKSPPAKSIEPPTAVQAAEGITIEEMMKDILKAFVASIDGHSDDSNMRS
jgi:hypothetical protein